MDAGQDRQPVPYPLVHPCSFFHSPSYVGDYERAITYRPVKDHPNVKILSASTMRANRLMADFERIAVERAGVMAGEYVVLPGGFMLMDRQGTCTAVNFPFESAFRAHLPFDVVNDPDHWAMRERILETWDTLPKLEKPTIISHLYAKNYYHFSHELFQQFRLIEGRDVESLIIHPFTVTLSFQGDLIEKVLGGRSLFLSDTSIRVDNPVVTQAQQSDEGLLWLRGLMGIDVSPGKARYYVRRAPKKNRPGNNIQESDAFLKFLARWNFQIVDFGEGQHAIEKQVRMLDQAAVVLSAHGAGLTNLGYLSAPLKVIEVFGGGMLFAGYMQIAMSLSFDYYGLITEALDADGSIIVDVDQLEAVMREA